MKTIDKSPEVLARLQSFETFRGLPPEPLQWLIDRSDYPLYERGDLLFSPGEKVDHIQVIVQGRYLIEKEQEGETLELGVCETGYITGVLPHGGSRGLRAGAGGLLRAGAAPALLLGTGTVHPILLLSYGSYSFGLWIELQGPLRHLLCLFGIAG